MAMVISVQHLEQISAALKSDVIRCHKIVRFTVHKTQHLPAAAPHVIVICHVNIKHQLLLQGLEGA